MRKKMEKDLCILCGKNEKTSEDICGACLKTIYVSCCSDEICEHCQKPIKKEIMK